MLTRATATVEFRSVLLETERPEVLVGRDSFGTSYLCSLVTFTTTDAQFLAVPISDERLVQVQRGEMDLRSALAEPEFAIHYFGTVPTAQDWRRVDFVAVDEVRDAWLPDAGLKLTDFHDEIPSDRVVFDAVGEGVPSVVCRLSPPEALGTRPRINADRLAECVATFQSFVREATRSVLKQVKDENKVGFFGDDPSLLQVVGLSTGSVQVHFSAASHAVDLFGGNPITDGLTTMDRLMRLASGEADDPLVVLRENKGQVLAAYQHLLEFVIESDTPFEYRWADPFRRQARGARVTPTGATAMCAILDRQESLKTERFEITGQFKAVNTTTAPHTWAVWDINKRRLRRGFVHEHPQDRLDGVTIGTETYVLVGEERLLKPTVGRAVRKLFVQTISKAMSS